MRGGRGRQAPTKNHGLCFRRSERGGALSTRAAPTAPAKTQAAPDLGACSQHTGLNPSSPVPRSRESRGAVQAVAPPAGARCANGLQPDRGVEDIPAAPGRAAPDLPVSCRASGPRGRPARGRREGPSLSGAEAADTPHSLFRAWATAEVAQSVVWCAGLTPEVVGEPQLFEAFQGPG
ncbi:hypothetical protein NDU88_003981 [Pleurodeles waltl]|uniref:Uncharacterized protein n=1 Tax=Pleurodeles waltl TaxID=8319 RepID=A0AAV7RFS2_PLEWA|nr:hypothetical protein NDU88_003981 [Pleurodeles waltl]